jgi:hypothetical protein
VIAFVNFFDKYIELNLKDYSLGIDLEINKIILMFAIGISIACFFINMRQGAIATLLKKLIRSDAFGEENAVSLKELGLDKNSSVKRLISKKEGYLKRIIKRVGERDITYEEYMESISSNKKKGEKSAPVSKNTEENRQNSDNSSEGEPSEYNTSSEGADCCDAVCASVSMGSDTLSEEGAVSTETSTRNSADGARGGVACEGDTVSDDALYYIPNEEKAFALRTFEKNSASVIKAILMSVLVLGFSFAAILVMPSLLSLFNG